MGKAQANRWPWMVVLLGFLIGAAGCPVKRSTTEKSPPATDSTRPAAPTPDASRVVIDFTDVTALSGVKFTYQNGREAGHLAILETVGGGVGLIDYDGDGRLDLFFPGGGRFQGKEILGRPSALYRNLGEWRFQDVSAPAAEGFAAPHYTHGCFGADYDNDGFVDLLVTGYGGLQLWRNQGDGTLVECRHEARLEDSLWSSAAGWGDVNGDGALDLYVVHYVNWSFENHPVCAGMGPRQVDVCSPKAFSPLPDSFFLSNGDGTFRDASQEVGLRRDGKGLGVVIGDVDLDGDVDIYVANDTTENFLYLNDGAGVLREEGALRGVATDDFGVPNGSMGVDLGDFNLDGLPDIWVANFEVESFALYRNEGNAQFLHVSRATGVTALKGLFVGFGTAFADLDCDGDEDLIVANGHVLNYPQAAPFLQVPLVLVNHQGRQYHRLSWPEDSYLGSPHAGRGLAVGDLDEDGDLDLAFANNQEPVALLRNDSRCEGKPVRIRFVGRRSNRDALGASCILETSKGDQLRLIKGGGTYLSQNELVTTWGVAVDAAIQGLRIRWPLGEEQHIASSRLVDGAVFTEP